MASKEHLRVYVNPALSAQELIGLLRRARDSRRERQAGYVQRVIENTSLLLAAYADGRLVGVLRALSDFSVCCYIADVIVDRNFSREGVLSALLAEVRHDLDDECEIILPAGLQPEIAVAANT